MKKIYLLLMVFGFIIPLAMLAGCDDDELNEADMEPSIIITTPRANVAKIDLDKGTGPDIHGWALAPAGLAKVNITVTTEQGENVLLNEEQFTAENSEKNGTAYEFNVYPDYTPDFRSISITVVDLQGRSADFSPYEVGASGGTSGPVFESFPEKLEANIRPEVNITPELRGNVKSHWGLKSVSITAVNREDEETLAHVTDFGSTPNSYTVNLMPDYSKGYAEGMHEIKIVGVDGRDFSDTLVIPVTILEAAEKPQIEFGEESIEADLTKSPEIRPVISGTVKADGGLVSVAFYTIGTEGEVMHGNEITSFDDVNEYNFEFDDIPYALGMRAFKVVAEDIEGQVTTEELKVKVIAEDPNLQTFTNIEIWGAGERFDKPSAFSFSDGKVYIYDEEPTENMEIAKSIYFIATAPGNGDPSYDIMSPLEGWLGNNYYKGVEWLYNNDTKVRVLDADEVDFESATSMDIEKIPLGDASTRARAIQTGSRTVLFESEEGVKGLIYLVSTEENPGSHKNDKMVFEIKVLK